MIQPAVSHPNHGLMIENVDTFIVEVFEELPVPDTDRAAGAPRLIANVRRTD